jgi:hypothetical protein
MEITLDLDQEAAPAIYRLIYRSQRPSKATHET